jgi:hypothetical protein
MLRGVFPGVETPGYFHLRLRRGKSGINLQTPICFSIAPQIFLSHEYRLPEAATRRLTIARRFNAGSVAKQSPVPKGRLRFSK